jgi:hypothetical protein
VGYRDILLLRIGLLNHNFLDQGINALKLRRKRRKIRLFLKMSRLNDSCDGRNGWKKFSVVVIIYVCLVNRRAYCF